MKIVAVNITTGRERSRHKPSISVSIVKCKTSISIEPEMLCVLDCLAARAGQTRAAYISPLWLAYEGKNFSAHLRSHLVRELVRIFGLPIPMERRKKRPGRYFCSCQVGQTPPS